jgi:8-hydroxy-5-deazaflavin:NADPH oxidoreductase
MKLAILGAGNLGSALAKLLVGAGHDVTLSFSLDQAQLAETAASVGAKWAEVAPSVASAEVVVFAMNWNAVRAAVAAAGSLEGKIVWDCTVPLLPDYSGLEVGRDNSAGEVVAGLAKGARVVKAVPPPAELLHAFPAAAKSIRPSVFVCGNDTKAKQAVAALVNAIGTEAVDAGPITSARATEPLIVLLVQLAYGMKLGGKIGIGLLNYD